MRSTTIRASFFIAFVGAIAACSAAANDPAADSPDGSDDGSPALDQDSGSDMDATTGDMDSTTHVDSGTDSGGGDSALHDTGIIDAPFDGVIVLDASFDPPGSPCSPAGLTQRDPHCGFCGHRDRVCLALTDGGATTWQPWGACVSQVAGGCAPGTMDSVTCGFCGTQPRSCNNFCEWEVGGCSGSGVCAPGSTTYASALSCDAGLGRTTSCDNMCHWGLPSVTCDPPPTTITISQTPGAIATSAFDLGAATLRINPGDTFSPPTCPVTISTTSTVSSYIKVINTNATHSATVSIWSSLPMGGTIIDTVMASYPASASPPTTAAARKACGSSSDGCTSSLSATACQNSWAGLMQDDSIDNSVTIPANSFVWIYVGAWFTSTTSGSFQLSAYTNSIN